MADERAPQKIININPQHGGVRFAVVLGIVLGLIFSFFLIRYLILKFAPGTSLSDFVLVTSCAGAIPLALASAWLFEKVLLKFWPSGMMLILEDEGLRYVDHHSKGPEDSTEKFSLRFYFDQRITITRWFFALKGYPKGGRERTIPEQWFCCSCQFQQNDNIMIVFSYLSPKSAEAWIDKQGLSEDFVRISMADIYRNDGLRLWRNPGRPPIETNLLTGNLGRQWLAERRRWAEGLEVSDTDFSYLMKYIETNYDREYS